MNSNENHEADQVPKQSSSAAPQASKAGEEGSAALPQKEASEHSTVPTQKERLVMACELTLLFYTVGPWTDAKRQEWSEKMDAILGPALERDERVVGANGDGTWDGACPGNEATTKNLCNAMRAALAYED